MKETLHYLDPIKIHAWDIDYDIDGGSDGSTATDQERLKGPAILHLPDHKSCEYELLTPLSDRPEIS